MTFSSDILQRSAITCVMLLAMLFAVPATTEAQVETQKRDPALTERMFKASWPAFRNQFVKVHDEYLVATTYDTRFMNAAHTTSAQYIKDNTKTVEFALPTSWLNGSRIAPSRTEADAATRILTGIKPGDYGYIQSGKIDAILDAHTILLTNIQLLDAAAVQRERDADEKAMFAYLQDKKDEQRQENIARWRNNQAGVIGPGRVATYNQATTLLNWRFEQRDKALKLQENLADKPIILTGLATTQTVRKGSTFGGLRSSVGQQIYIIGTATRPTTDGKGQRCLLAIDGSALKRGLNEAEFRAMLKQADISIETFADTVTAARKADPTGYKPTALEALGLGTDGAVSQAAQPEQSAPTKDQPKQAGNDKSNKSDQAAAKEKRNQMREDIEKATGKKWNEMSREERRAAFREWRKKNK